LERRLDIFADFYRMVSLNPHPRYSRKINK
jgi:hypothetical protein